MVIEDKSRSGEIKYKDKTLIKFEITYPTVSGITCAGRINLANGRIAGEKISYIQSRLYAAARQQFETLNTAGVFSPFSYQSYYEVMRNTSGVLSLFFDTYVSRGAEGNLILRNSQTWDLKNGRTLSFDSLFKRNTPWLEKCMEIGERKVLSFEKEMGAHCFADWKKQLVRSIKMGRFYLSDDGVTLWLPQGSIASDIWGIPTVLLLYGEIEGIIDKRFM